MVASPLAAICRSCAERAVAMLAARTEDGDLEAPTAPWETMTSEDLLTRLPEVAAAGQQVEQHLSEWVRVARDRGISWARIGASLGMTRQSAWERFKAAG